MTGRPAISTTGLCPEHFKGASSEHLAASYFLSRGYEVFWPAVQQGGTDFAIRKSGTFQAVQVKTATWNRASPPYAYLQCRTRTTNNPGRKPTDLADIYAIVHVPDIWVVPAAAIDSSNLSLGSTCIPRKPTRWDKYKSGILPSE